ncbi:MAG: BrnT family toxin [Sulfurospirillum sp.]|nr:BrnT family toxin [Sulfurospirillum sp.]
MFEYDEAKSQANKEKHGIDFEEAQALWDNEYSVFKQVEINNEERFLLVGYIGELCYVAVFTMREDNIRIISVRRCRKNEKEIV